MEKKSTVKSNTNSSDNSFGLASAILGIMSIIFATSDSVGGIILAIIALVFANKQNSVSETKWSRYGKILGVLGLILNIILLITAIIFIVQNYDKISQIGGILNAP